MANPYFPNDYWPDEAGTSAPIPPDPPVTGLSGQSLLNYMEIFFPELQLQPGENNVAQGLLALNMAQDAFETLIAQEPEMLGGTVGTVTTTAGQEYTTYPTGLLRLDKVQYLSPSTGLPVWNLERIQVPGSHAYPVIWPGNLVSSSTQGVPRSYWANGTRIYWTPVPNAVHTVRWYGFQTAADLTAAGAFVYPDPVASALATFAVRLLRTGLDDGVGDIGGLAQSILKPAIAMLANFNRDGASAFRYKYVHRS